MRRLERMVVVGAIAFGGLAGSIQAQESKERVRLEDVPAPVRATIEREARGGSVYKVEREREHGKTYYEAEIKKADREVELKVAGDGTVRSRRAGD